jgi:hypothetical protein
VSELQLALLRELVSTDNALSAELEALDRAAAEVAEIRARADELTALLGRADGERARLEGELGEAERDRDERAVAASDAAAQLAAAEQKGDAERLAAARRFDVRARDALSVAERRARAAADALASFDDRVERAKQDVPSVERRAADIASSLRGRPRIAEQASRAPGPGLAGVAEWASVARAALVVARTSVAGEREAVIRQANELGSAVLGEPLVASSTAVVARRVEAARSG